MIRLAIVVAVSFGLGLSASAAISRGGDAGARVQSAAFAPSTFEGPAARYVSVGWLARRVVAR